jgi:hypothetical protein
MNTYHEQGGVYRQRTKRQIQLGRAGASNTGIRQRFAACLAAGFLLAVALPSHAQCQGCGTLVNAFVAGETWTAANSPYCVVSDVFVVGLTIESNVVVKFCSNYVFEVAGQLQVKGTSNAPVLFTPQDPAIGWKGILFSDALPGSFFNHAIIEGSKQGGVRINNTPPAFTNCVIRNNTTPGYGGGIYGALSGSPLVMQGCPITNNVATGGQGGGLWVSGSCALTRCMVADNRTTANFYEYGAGIFASGSCSLRNCVISKNATSATGVNIRGSGVCLGAGSLQMANCLVLTNGNPSIAGEGGGVAVGAPYITGPSAFIVNCIFSGNAHSTLYEDDGALALVNCTLAANRGVAFSSMRGSISVSNSIVYYNNGGGDQTPQYCVATFAYSDVQGGVRSGPGNISYNPSFCPQSQALILGSPCIDAGNPDQAYNDVCLDNSFCTTSAHGTVRNDMGAYGGPGACNWLAGDAPGIFTQPQSQSSCLGQTATFTVTATGSLPLTYHWYFNGALLSGQASNRLALANLHTSNSGPYAVVVANAFGSVTSAPANLLVQDACVDLHMYAGLDISGQAGRTYVLSYVNDLDNTNWTALATNTLGGSSWFYLDMESAFQPKRFYKVKLGQ